MTRPVKPRRATRGDRARMMRAVCEALVLPAIGQTARRAGLRGDDAFSAFLGEVDTIKELRHITRGLP